MRDYASYFLDRTPPQKKGVSISRDIDWWMEYLASRMGKSLFLWLFAILFLLLWLLWQAGMDSRIFPVNRIVLTGDVLMTKPSSIQKALNNFNENSFFNLNINHVADKVEALPWIEKAIVTRQWPGNLKINLVERKAAYRWGKNDLIDSDGHRFSNNYSQEFSSLPQLIGVDGHESEVIFAYQKLLDKLGSNVKDLGIDSFVLNRYLSWELHLKSGLVVKFGRDNFKERLSRFVGAYQQGRLPKLEEIDLIDLRYQKGFSVKWKPEYAPDLFKQLILKVSTEEV